MASTDPTPASVATAPQDGSTTSAEAIAAPAAPSKSSLKKAEKEAALAAKKALKKVAGLAPPVAAGQGKKKEVKVKEATPEGPPFIDVPEGHIKDLTNPMAAGYNPVDVEKSWYSWWQKSNYFVPALPSKNPTEHSHFEPHPDYLPRDENGQIDFDRLDKDKTFVIPMPPPNVTGSLHIGHALGCSLQDILIRWHRMKGYTTLFVPGYDHASISTQSVVEKRLAKLEGLTRHDLGREEFLKRCMAWKEDYQGRITKQICRLGVSCDWDRVAFTMDPALSKAVAETFVRLQEEGIIYRANRLVNWCVQMNTTLSALEVDQKVLTGRTLLNVPGYPINEKFEFGVITSFAYPLEGSDEKLIIATTRPETMLGDTAIAVHPDDPRYTHLHGKFAKHPFLDRRIPIVTDAIAVDMEFGTGAVKITPAHDPNDFEVGKRHDLEFINILSDDGTLNANAGPEFEGMKRFHARNAVIEKLKQRDLYVGAADNPMSIPVCSKSGDIIESIMKPQWWVSSKTLADEAIKRTRAGELLIRPQNSENEWYRWLETIQDWCISRQLWWGHRIPAYFVNIERKDQDRLSSESWVAAKTKEAAQQKAEARFPGEKFVLEQDEDVLDTWFSSGLWPFSIQGWPDQVSSKFFVRNVQARDRSFTAIQGHSLTQTQDLKAFYPSHLLETGWDILFFWVARMVMLGIKLTGQMPFNEVFCHAMIRDAHGRKMSKSLGNVIDPIDVIEGASLDALHAQLRVGNLVEKEIAVAEKGQKKDFPNGIPQCGTDALRFAMANYSAGGRDINLEILRVEGYRKFCNKLWNATRFALTKFEDGYVPPPSEKPTGRESLVEKWIMQKLNRATTSINTNLADRHFMKATEDMYSFWLYEICDVYIEAIKDITAADAPQEARRSAQDTLFTVLDNGLRLLHPVMPFVTEELWHRLPTRPGNETQSISLARYPEPAAHFEFEQAEKDFDLAFAAIRATRSIAVSYNINSKLQITFNVRDNAALASTLQSATKALRPLIKGCEQLTIVDNEADIPEGCVGELVSPELATNVMLKGVVNFEQEIAKAEKKKAFQEQAAQKIRDGMAAPGYEEKKPQHVRDKEAQKLSELFVEIEAITKSIEGFLKLKD